LIHDRLTINHFNVVTAKDGLEGIELARREQPNVILLDVVMPGMNGFEVCRRLRGYDDTKNIPIIFLSAKGRKEDRMEGVWAGGYDYVVKPYDPDVLIRKIKQAIKEKG